MGESLFFRKHSIEAARREKVRELMKEYDETIYDPARKAIREECAGIGHTPNGRLQFTVGGRAYQYCVSCGVTILEEEDTA
jgi:hypothetical protein